MEKPNLQPRWLPTGRAAESLGLGKSTLRRYAEDGLLSEVRHFKRGITPRSPWRWEVNGIATTLDHLATLPKAPVAAAAVGGGPADG